MKLTSIAMNPWDFTLYTSDDGSMVMKVMFSEGDYKTDVGRFFLVDALNTGADDMESLKAVAAQIRADYPSVALPVLDKAELQILK